MTDMIDRLLSDDTKWLNDEEDQWDRILSDVPGLLRELDSKFATRKEQIKSDIKNQQLETLRTQSQTSSVNLDVLSSKLQVLSNLDVIYAEFEKLSLMIKGNEFENAFTSLHSLREKLDVLYKLYGPILLYSDCIERCNSLEDSIRTCVKETWQKAIYVDKSGLTVDSELLSITYPFIEDHTVELFLMNLDDYLVTPMLAMHLKVSTEDIGQDGVFLKSEKGDHSIESLCLSVKSFVQVVSSCLPTELEARVRRRFANNMLNTLTRTSLPSLFPEKFEEIDLFKSSLVIVKDLDQALKACKWISSDDLVNWVENYQQEWKLFRESVFLDSLRSILLGTVSVREVISEQRQDTDNTPVAQMLEPEQVREGLETNEHTQEENDDWGWGDDADEQNGNDDDNWGWGDESSPTMSTSPVKKRQSKRWSKQVKELSKARIGEASLTENKPVVAMRRKITNLVDSLSESAARFSYETQQSAQQLVALYRALTPLIYTPEKLDTVTPVNFLIAYNDTVELTNQLELRAADMNILKQHGNGQLTSLLSECKRVLAEIFGRGFYKDSVVSAMELVSRYTSLFAEYSDTAVVFKLGGYLANQVVAWVMGEIMGQVDISQDESEQLVRLSNDLCGSIEDLFNKDSTLAGSYVPSWFKFRYLIEILESSLADITYMHENGLLRDFSGDELRRLVSALFAPSEKRHKVLEVVGG